MPTAKKIKRFKMSSTTGIERERERASSWDVFWKRWQNLPTEGTNEKWPLREHRCVCVYVLVVAAHLVDFTVIVSEWGFNCEGVRTHLQWSDRAVTLSGSAVQRWERVNGCMCIPSRATSQVTTKWSVWEGVKAPRGFSDDHKRVVKVVWGTMKHSVRWERYGRR